MVSQVWPQEETGERHKETKCQKKEKKVLYRCRKGSLCATQSHGEGLVRRQEGQAEQGESRGWSLYWGFIGKDRRGKVNSSGLGV